MPLPENTSLSPEKQQTNLGIIKERFSNKILKDALDDNDSNITNLAKYGLLMDKFIYGNEREFSNYIQTYNNLNINWNKIEKLYQYGIIKPTDTISIEDLERINNCNTKKIGELVKKGLKIGLNIIEEISKEETEIDDEKVQGFAELGYPVTDIERLKPYTRIPFQTIKEVRDYFYTREEYDYSTQMEKDFKNTPEQRLQRIKENHFEQTFQRMTKRIIESGCNLNNLKILEEKTGNKFSMGEFLSENKLSGCYTLDLYDLAGLERLKQQGYHPSNSTIIRSKGNNIMRKNFKKFINTNLLPKEKFDHVFENIQKNSFSYKDIPWLLFQGDINDNNKNDTIRLIAKKDDGKTLSEYAKFKEYKTPPVQDKSSYTIDEIADIINRLKEERTKENDN